jgi:hypothetical protein
VALVDALGNLVRFILLPGQRHDIVGVEPLIENCLVPGSRDAKLSREAEEALWQAFFTAAPGQRREFEPNSKRRKRRRASSPNCMG